MFVLVGTDNAVCDIPLVDVGGRFFGSGALSGKMLLVTIIENNKINANFRAG